MELPGVTHLSLDGELVSNQEGLECSSSSEMSKKQLCVCTRNPTNHGNVQGTTTCHAPHRDQAHDKYAARQQQQQQQQCDRQAAHSAVDSPSANNRSSSSSSSVARDGVSYCSVMSPWKQAASPAVYCATSTNKRRNRVYDNIMGQWEQAASSYVPSPRSSHRRVLGGQALPTRQRGESLSLENIDNGQQPSWGNLSDTVSPAVQFVWREQLLRLKLTRLAGVPMTVLLRQRGVGNAGTGTKACRVVASSQCLSAKLTALAVIEGTCQDVALSSSSKPAVGSTEGSPRTSAGTCRETATANVGVLQQEAMQQQQQQQQQRCQNSGTNKCSREAYGRLGVEEPRGKVNVDQSCTTVSTGSVTSGSSSSERRTKVPLPSAVFSPLAKPPARGFHLVDLHAVVRNSVEWRHCLPKVEPCFRVGSNRDSVLLGLVHALGGRLSCSSAHDFKAGVGAARHASPIPAPPPRLFDRHVCRPPGLLRASVTAGVQLYEVDSADELRRIRAARRKLELSVGSRPRSETPHGRTATVLGPASVMVRLAMPYRSKRQLPDGPVESPDVADFSGACEAVYGAGAEDVVELVHAATAAPVGPECGVTEKPSTPVASWCGSGRGSSGSLPIVGFSIDVGPACWNDALGNAAALPAVGSTRPSAPCPASAIATTGVASEASGEAIPSASLAESIDAAVAFAVSMARVAAEAGAVATVATTPTAAAATVNVDGGATGNREGDGSLRIANASSTSRPVTKTPTTPTWTSSSSAQPPFSFQRLHVTGLGKGGARGEPLVALKAALARHLPAVTAAATAAAAAAAATTAPGGNHGISGSRSGGTLPLRAPVTRPIVVSADATEYLVSGGVWSTVASIIGRKSVPPVAVAVDADRSPISPSPTEDGGIGGGSTSSSGVAAAGGGGNCSPAGKVVVEDDGESAGAGGAMYYIDDGCYGSLSGALLRGVQMQPSPLRVHLPQLQRDIGSLSTPAPFAAAAAAAGEPGPDCQDGRETSSRAGSAPTSGAVSEPTTSGAEELTSCTVWGPTCDGLDCVCRTTQLPGDMEPGRDWLFFPDVGIRSAADATDFNGLKPLDSFYLIRPRGDPAPAPLPAPMVHPPLAGPVYP